MEKFDRNFPHNELQLLPPKAEVETKQVLRRTISASGALAQLNGTLLNLPKPILFLDTIYLQEAKAGSEVENIIIAKDEPYKSLTVDRKIKNSTTKGVLSYKKALWLGLEELKTKPFTATNLCVAIVQRIKQNNVSIRKKPGTTLKNTQGEVINTPQSGEQIIREKLASLEKFINEPARTAGGDETSSGERSRTIDPLIKMAILHCQFEAIHPFSDFNGRTGRILMLLYPKISGLLNTPAIYLSEYFINNKIEYYRYLGDVKEKNNWEDYILYTLDMIEETANKGLKRLNKISVAM